MTPSAVVRESIQAHKHVNYHVSYGPEINANTHRGALEDPFLAFLHFAGRNNLLSAFMDMHLKNTQVQG